LTVSVPASGTTVHSESLTRQLDVTVVTPKGTSATSPADQFGYYMP
jgi:hypothetical protein